MMYKHYVGPYKGGLNVDYDKSMPYYPTSIRDRMGKGEVQPIQEITEHEACQILWIRDPRRNYIAKEAKKIR